MCVYIYIYKMSSVLSSTKCLSHTKILEIMKIMKNHENHENHVNQVNNEK